MKFPDIISGETKLMCNRGLVALGHVTFFFFFAKFSEERDVVYGSHDVRSRDRRFPAKFSGES